jgi:hypothetical protein
MFSATCRICPNWRNVILKHKLQVNTQPGNGICTLLQAAYLYSSKLTLKSYTMYRVKFSLKLKQQC